MKKCGTLFIIILLNILIEMSSQQLAPNDLKPLKTKAPKADEAVIIVGGGLAGLSAALEALKADATVILIDKAKDLGGNSAKASSGKLFLCFLILNMYISSDSQM